MHSIYIYISIYLSAMKHTGNRQYLDSILDLDPNLDLINVLDSITIYFSLNSLTLIILLARLVFSRLSEIVRARNPQN